MKFFKKKSASQVSLSTYVEKDLLLIETPANLQTWTYRFWIFCHGSYFFAFIGQILLATSYACTLTAHPTEYEFFYGSAVYGMLSVAGVYQIYWFRNRGRTAALFEKLLDLTKRFEVDFTGKEFRMSKTARRTMMIVVRGLQLTFVGEVFTICGKPLLDARLPTFMRGMKPFSPGMLATQAVQLFVMIPIALSTAQYLTTQTKLIFFLTVGYRIIGRRLRQLDLTIQKEVTDTVRLHSEWMALSAESEKLFSAWNTVFVMDMLMIALIGTVGVISGVIVFEITLLAPSVGSYIFVMCQLGELLKEQSGLVADYIFEGNWIYGNGKLRKILGISILRAHRPAIMRATLIGPLTLKTFLTVLKQWYRFLQFLLNLKK